MPENRLPSILMKECVKKNVGWYKDLNNVLQKYNIQISFSLEDTNNWAKNFDVSLKDTRIRLRGSFIEKARESNRPIYKHLHHDLNYMSDDLPIHYISWIFKARAGLLYLNNLRVGEEENKMCALCNLNEIEDTMHFLARCPILSEFRVKHLKKLRLSDSEVFGLLNGSNWQGLIEFCRTAWAYRYFLISEFNF